MKKTMTKTVSGPPNRQKPGNNLIKGLTKELSIEDLVDVCFGFQLIKYRNGQDAKRLERDLLRLPSQTLRAIFILALIADRSASHGYARFVVNAEVVKSVLREFKSERIPSDSKKRHTTGLLLGNHGEARQAVAIALAMQRATQRRQQRFADDPAAK
jgi:hypothetical protein